LRWKSNVDHRSPIIQADDGKYQLFVLLKENNFHQMCHEGIVDKMRIYQIEVNQ